MAASSFRRTVDRLGVVACAAYAVVAVLSYGQVTILWSLPDFPNAIAYFTQVAGEPAIASIRDFFGGPWGVLITRWVPVTIAASTAVTLLIMLGRNRREADDEVADAILRWSMVFAGICFFAYPVFTQDFWLSAIWGEMVVSGTNPYQHKFTPEMIQALPLDHFPMTMSYGPFWAVISAAVMAIAGNSLIVAALIFKAILLAAWCGTIILVDRLVRQVAPDNRAFALTVVGWLPVGVLETVAEGHNDIALVFPALVWLALLLRGNAKAPIALAASVLCKYTTAPFFLIDFLHCLKGQRMSLGAYVSRGVPAAIFGILVMAIFYRGASFFDGARLVDSWHFMQPSDAYLAITDFLGGWGEPLENLFLTIFPGIALYQLAVYWKQSDTEQLFRLTLASICAISFAAIGHVWSWYLVWMLPLAALVPGWWLARFIVGMTLAAPFLPLLWWVPEVEEYKNVAALVLYLAATGWTILSAPKQVESAEGAAAAPVRLIDFAKARDKLLGRVNTARAEPELEPELARPVRAAASGEH